MRKIKPNVIFRVALVLLCLVLFSAHLSSGMLAKYSMSGSGSGGAHVADTKVTVSSRATAPTVDADGSAEYPITITNESKVAVRYSLIVRVISTLSNDELAVACANVKLGSVDGVFDSSLRTFTFADLGEMVPGDTVDATLSFRADDFVTATYTSGDLLSKYENIKLVFAVKSVQID